MNRRKFLGLAGLSAAGALMGKAKKCDSCGAPLRGTTCEYCKTEHWTEKDLGYKIEDTSPGDGCHTSTAVCLTACF